MIAPRHKPGRAVPSRAQQCPPPALQQPSPQTSPCASQSYVWRCTSENILVLFDRAGSIFGQTINNFLTDVDIEIDHARLAWCIDIEDRKSVVKGKSVTVR